MLCFSVVDGGFYFRYPDPNFSIPDPGSKRSRIRIEFKLFSPKNCLYTLGNIIRDVHPGSLFFYTPEQGVIKALDPDPKHWLCFRIRSDLHHFFRFNPGIMILLLKNLKWLKSLAIMYPTLKVCSHHHRTRYHTTLHEVFHFFIGKSRSRH